MLEEAVVSARRAAGSLSYEFVICDGGSDDGSLEWLREQSDVRLIEHGKLRGAVNAYMDCFAIAQGEYVVWINDDLNLQAGSLETAVQILRGNSQVGLVSLAWKNPGQDRRWKSKARLAGQSKSYPFAWFGVVRKEDGDRAGWFSRNFRHYAGDMWISMQIQAMGLEIVELPDFTAQHASAWNSVRNGVDYAIGKQDNLLFHELGRKEFMTLGMIEHRALVTMIRDTYKVLVFVETGTYKGDTTLWAASQFKRVVTIEAFEWRYNKTKESLPALKNVKFILGDSRIELAKVLLKEPVPAILWLDAHWKNNYEESLGTPGECPLIDELKAIREDDFILIDDARLFSNEPRLPRDENQWPSLDEIKSMLPGRYIVVWEDVIIAVPQKAETFLREAMSKYGNS